MEIGEVKSRKATGMDGVAGEMMKYGGDAVVE